MQWLWPSIDDMEDADVRTRSGSAVAIFISILTASITFLQTTGTINWVSFIDMNAYIDAGLFLIIGIGIRAHSRIAALAGLLLYGYEQYIMIQAYGFRFNLLALFFIIVFMNAARGAFVYHYCKRKIKKDAASTPMPQGPISVLTGLPVPQSPPREPQPPMDKPENPKKKFPLLSMIMTFLTLLIIGLAVTTFSSPGLREKIRSTLPEEKNRPLNNELQKLEIEKGAAPAPDADVKTFKLKSGKIITGRVVVDDPFYISVQVSLKKQEIILKEDLAKE